MSTITKMYPATHAVLVQFDFDSDLHHVTADRSAALLGVVGLPVLHHWLDRLKVAGIEHVVIVSSRFPEQLRHYVGRGERWGFVSVEHVSTGNLTSWQQVHGLTASVSEHFCVYASLNTYPTQPLNRQACNEYCWVNWKTKADKGETVFPIRSLNSLWLVNMQVIKKRITNSHIPIAAIHKRAKIESSVCLADAVVVRSQVSISDSVIGKNVDIGESTEIIQSVILDNTLIGSHLRLKRVIVDGPFVYDIDTKCRLKCNDPNLFTRLRKSIHDAVPFERLIALVLLLITGPIWLFSKSRPNRIKISTGAAFDGSPILNEVCVRNLQSENSFAVRIPWLWAVVKGQLPLFGIRESADEDPIITQDETQPGVISLADFSDQDPDTRALANAYQIHRQSTRDNLLLLTKWIPKVFYRRSA